MSINIGSEYDCLVAYRNYHCEGNSMGITADEMAAICDQWEGKLTSWNESICSEDETLRDFEFDNSEFLDAMREEGANDAQEYAGGESTNMAGEKWENAGGAAVGVAGAAVAVSGIGEGIANVGNICRGVKGVFNGGSVSQGAKVASSGKTSASAYVAAGMAIANAAYYWAARPNKEEKEACDALQDVMAGSQAALTDAQGQIVDTQTQVAELSEEANDYNDAANEVIINEATTYELYALSYNALLAKANSGQPLSDSEKALFQISVTYMVAAGDTIGNTSEEAGTVVNSIYDDLETYNVSFEDVAGTMAEVLGATDYAAAIDDTTQNLCYVQSVGQFANAASGAVAGARLLAGGFWNWALGIASIAAGVSSAAAGVEQKDWAGQVGNEIALREATQLMNEETAEFHEEEFVNYEAIMSTVEELEYEVPSEIAPPPVVTLPGQATTTTTTSATAAPAAATTTTTTTTNTGTADNASDDSTKAGNKTEAEKNKENK
ncbi:MAG: hypothetical protein E7Z89_06645 [Cyanobacteria bacterium SIG28]|nr:hypothetical protein [Cyanobacteria bacterium SIG28]